MYEAYSHTEGELERAYLVPESLPTVTISSDNDTDSAKESNGKYDSERNSDVDMCMEDDVDATDGVVLDSDVDLEMEDDDEAEEDEEEEHKMEKEDMNEDEK